MKNLVVRRLVAFMLDYVIIVIYALLLYGVTTALPLEGMKLSPVSGQVVGFFSLTLPVFCYFFLTERGPAKATIGKRVMRISVGTPSCHSNILLRNFLKFLPWEIAHTGVHWVVFYTNSAMEVPIWVWCLLILPQMVVLAYLFGVFLSGGKRGIYDRVSNTCIEMAK